MPWQKVAETPVATIYGWVPDSEVGTPVEDAPPPLGDLGALCELRTLYPCIEAHPLKADWMVKYAECDCEVPAEAQVQGCCNGCFLELLDALSQDEAKYVCSCGVVYRPGTSVIADVVRLP